MQANLLVRLSEDLQLAAAPSLDPDEEGDHDEQTITQANREVTAQLPCHSSPDPEREGQHDDASCPAQVRKHAGQAQHAS
jgi:hypothetical protein